MDSSSDFVLNTLRVAGIPVDDFSPWRHMLHHARHERAEQKPVPLKERLDMPAQRKLMTVDRQRVDDVRIAAEQPGPERDAGDSLDLGDRGDRR